MFVTFIVILSKSYNGSNGVLHISTLLDFTLVMINFDLINMQCTFWR